MQEDRDASGLQAPETRKIELRRRGSGEPALPRRPEQCGMNAPCRMRGPVRKILLATDLSARCDRALSRAAMLAEQWQSPLVVLHVVGDRDPDIPDAAGLPSWRRPIDRLDIARKHLLADAEALPIRPTLLIAGGNPVEAILRGADAEGCDLIVIGVGRDEPLRRLIPGGTADRLLRRSRVPLLVVKDRPHRPYENVVFATDLSAASRFALETAARLFFGQRLTIFHAYRPPYGLLTEPASHRQCRKDIEQDVASFLAGVDRSAPGWRRPQVLVEDGEPNFLLRDYVRDKSADLLVLGMRERNAFLEMFLGNTARTIIDDVPCDALVVREPRGDRE